MKRQKLSPVVDPFDDAPLPPEEFDRRVRAALAALDGPEGEHLGALIEWFMRRYPTPAERLAYNRRACAVWATASR